VCVLRNGRHIEVVSEFAFDIMQFKSSFMSKMNKYVLRIRRHKDISGG